MATTTLNSHSLTGSEQEQGLLSRIASKLVEARMRSAERAVNAYLLSLDDATLERLGHKREDIAARDPIGYPFL